MPGVFLASSSNPLRMLAGSAQCWHSTSWLAGHQCARAEILSLGCLDTFAHTLSVWGADSLRRGHSTCRHPSWTAATALPVSVSSESRSWKGASANCLCVCVLDWAVCQVPKDEPDTGLPLMTPDCVLTSRNHQSKT